MDFIFDVGEDISFVLGNSEPDPAHGGLPGYAAFLTNYADSVIAADAELSDFGEEN